MTSRRRFRTVVSATLRSTLLRVVLAAAGLLCLWAPADAQPYQGFGAGTRGGSGGSVVRVTNLRDSGSGSLRAALSRGNRTVVFDVAGDIVLSNHLYVQGAFITIDGFTAPRPGITLRGRGLIIRGTRGAHDIVVRGIRIRNASIDGIQVATGAYNVVIDHVSVDHSADGNIDITTSAHDVTVSWSLLTGNGKNVLIKYDPSRITLHHNVFAGSLTRNPQARIDDAGTPARDTTLDMRNNVVWGWGRGYGTLVWYGPWANLVNNVYIPNGGDVRDALTVTASAQAYVAGNVLAQRVAFDINAQRTTRLPFPAPAVDTEDACAAAIRVLAGAGARPLDAIDRAYLSAVSRAGCQVR